MLVDVNRSKHAYYERSADNSENFTNIFEKDFLTEIKDHKISKKECYTFLKEYKYFFTEEEKG